MSSKPSLSDSAFEQCFGIWDPYTEPVPSKCLPYPRDDCDDQTKIEADPFGLGMECFGEILDFTFGCLGHVDWMASSETKTVYTDADGLCQMYADAHPTEAAVLKKHAALKLKSRRVMQLQNDGTCAGVWGEEGECYPVPDELCDDQAALDADPWGLGMDCLQDVINFSFACIDTVDYELSTEDWTWYNNEYCQEYSDAHAEYAIMAKKYKNMSKQQRYQVLSKDQMVARTQLMQVHGAQAESFNYGAAAIGATAGLFLTYGLLKTLKSKNTSDEFQRA